MKNNYLLLFAFLFTIGITSAQSPYVGGVFMLNEGQFGTNTASVSFLNGLGTLNNAIFSSENSSAQLGNTAQGMGFSGDYAYVVLNGSNEVKVLDRNTFTLVATVSTGLSNPRYIAFANGMGYITNWGDASNSADDYVAVLDLSTNIIDPSNNISVVEGPEEIIKSGNQLFVAHQGGFSTNDKVSVINLTDNSISSITVGDRPNSLEVDDNYLYVLSSGEPAWTGNETAGVLHRVSLTDFTAIDTFTFATTEHPNFLEVENGEAFYVLNNNIYQFDFSGSLPTTAFVNTSSEGIAIAYGMSFIDGVFYLADAVDYVQNGKVATYDTSGSHLETYTVGLIPNGIYKNNEPFSVGPYAPPAEQAGSTAIATANSLFVDWASGATVTRGLQDIADANSGLASFGDPVNGTGIADNTLVSLGDAGEAILTFTTPIADESGYDFAVFENSFSDTFLELAFVEVSSDGVNYFRFPAHSLTSTDTQVGGFGDVDATFINNLAGKYKANFGTPFDLSDIADDPLLDKDNITHVKIIDAVGTIDPAFASYDAYGNEVNDPYPTPFASSGFDLDAVGVINQSSLGLDDVSAQRKITMFPNPASNYFSIGGYNHNVNVDIYSQTGKLVKSLKDVSADNIDISNFVRGMYIVKVTGDTKSKLFKLIKQ